MDVSQFIPTEQEWLETDFSFSKLNTFRMCARKARLRYLEQIVDDTIYLLYGKAIHTGQEADNMAKLEGRILPLPEILDRAVGHLKEEAGPLEDQVNLDLFVMEHLRQLEVLEEKGIRKMVRPVPKTIEAPFEIELTIQGQKPATLKGFVDLVSQVDPEVREVLDYKSGSRPVYQKVAAGSFQFALYDLGAKVCRHRIISFVRGGRQKPTVHVTEPVVLTNRMTDNLLTFLEDSITAWRAALKSGDWPKCNPGAHYCSAKACAYYERCYPGNREGAKAYFGSIKAVGTMERPDWRR